MSPIRTTAYTRQRTLLIGVLIVCAAIGLLAYIGFQARFLIEGPRLALADHLATVQRERQITLSGTARNITEITVNGRPIVTDETGAFAEPIVLENGYTLVRIEVRDRYGRTAAVERPFVYSPAAFTLAQ